MNYIILIILFFMFLLFSCYLIFKQNKLYYNKKYEKYYLNHFFIVVLFILNLIILFILSFDAYNGCCNEEERLINRYWLVLFADNSIYVLFFWFIYYIFNTFSLIYKNKKIK